MIRQRIKSRRSPAMKISCAGVPVPRTDRCPMRWTLDAQPSRRWEKAAVRAPDAEGANQKSKSCFPRLRPWRNDSAGGRRLASRPPFRLSCPATQKRRDESSMPSSLRIDDDASCIILARRHRPTRQPALARCKQFRLVLDLNPALPGRMLNVEDTVCI